MRVEVLLFAGLRERAGSRSVTLDLPHDARVTDVLDRTAALGRGASLVVAVNREYASPDTVLRAGDEVALIPPVSGGSPMHVRVTDEALSMDAIVARVRDPGAGATVVFSGTTRDTPYLDYEAYRAMATSELESLVDAAFARHGLLAVAAEHRFGRVELGDASVIVAVSAAHRPEAFAGAREIIDEIKLRVPIWKREDGEWQPGKTPIVPDAAGHLPHRNG